MGTRVFLLLLLSPAVLGLMVARCPEGWQARGGTDQCYLVHSRGRDRTFEDARVYCQARGGDLAYIDTAGLRDWLGHLVATTGNVSQNEYTWVGAKNVNGEWKWVENNQTVDNIMLPWDYLGSGNCAALTYESKLIKQECGQMLKFICHRNIQIPLACDYTYGWEDASDRCYKKSSQSISWAAAEMECVVEGGHLVSIENDAEQMLAHDLALEENDKVWTGYTEENHAGEFTWVDGSNSTVTYWQEGQPDLSLNGFGAAVVNNDDPYGLWMVEKVTSEFHYLCEKPVGSCLPGWETFEASCYYFNTETTDRKVWEDAKTICESVNAKMPVLDTDAEDTFFRDHVPENGNLWIGLYSKPHDGMYWTDDTSMDSKNYTHMPSEDEDTAIDKETQQCVYLQETVDTDGVTVISSWVPTDCTTPHHYACEAEVGAQINLIPPSNERFCLEGWEMFEDYCYYFSTEEMTWTAAEADCSKRNRDAHLVSILTWGESDFVLDNMRDQGWIGFNDRNEVDVWKWVDGRPVTITNWRSGEPDEDSASCVVMYSNDGKWADYECLLLQGYSCKMPASTSPIGTLTTTTATPDTSACGYDWTENPHTGECYRVEVQQLNFIDAQLHCKVLDYSDGQSKPGLVSISGVQEQDFISYLLASQHLSQYAVWMGMKNTFDEIKWTDDTPLTFINFEEREPSEHWGYDYISMDISSGKWSALAVDERLPFICEKKGKNYVGPQPPPRPSVECPTGWSHFSNNCYYFSPGITDWFTADASCNGMLGSSLASITNQDENDFIEKTMANISKSEKLWLGLRDDDNGEHWHWTDGTPLEWDNWGYGEPNSIGYHCGKIDGYDPYGSTNGKWYDEDCSDLNYYVCKFTVTLCPDSWVYDDDKCYAVSNSTATRNEGQEKCQEVNTKANLVNIHSGWENEFLKKQLSEDGGSCWLGMQYNGSQWIWADGTKMEYENWSTEEPVDDELCGLMIGPGEELHGEWRSQDCSMVQTYACELYPTHMIGCTDGWEAFEDYCYFYYAEDSKLPFDAAQQYCESLDANLASIHSLLENSFIHSLDTGIYNYFIGLSDIGHTNVFTWSDGTEVDFTFFEGFDYWELPSGDKCLASSQNSDLGWFIESCDYLNKFICKKPKEPISLDTDTHGCLEGDAYYRISCYNFPGTSDTWDNAKSDCESRGQHLVTLGNQYETAYFSALLGTVGTSVWLGLTGDIAGDGSVTFTWITGEALEYTFWDTNEPNPDHGTCVAASGDEDSPGVWAVTSCSDTFEYACEYERLGYTTQAPPTTRPASSYCLYGWEHQGQHCYQVMLDAATWGDGETRCGLFGAHLASVGDKAEEEMLLTLPGMEEVASQYGNVWVGLTMGSDTGYEWTDGSATDYVNWAEGQPDTHEGRETCVSGDATTLKLSASMGLTHLPFICEAASSAMQTTATVPTKPPTEMCSDEPSWYLYNDHCYKFVTSVDEEDQTWWESHMRCREEGGELASILSDEENYWIESMIYEISTLTMWIGGRAKLDAGYEWLDGQPFTYDNWGPGEPNNMNDQEDCIAMYTNNYGKWNDQNCGNTAGRICKRLHGSTHPPAQTTKAPDGHCPEGWIHTGTKCVYFIMELMNFTTSRQEGQKMGNKTDLASIHSAAEQAYLTAAMVTLDQHMWIGMSYTSGFMWVDQTSVTYTNWGPNEPNGGTDEEECVEVNAHTGLWSDVSCSDIFGSICMMIQDPNLPDHHTLNNCPEPYDAYTAYNGACYRAVDTPQAWEDADETCALEDAHLVSVLSISENSFVWAATQQNAFNNLWLGLTNNQHKETFSWSDGWPTTYTNWGRHEPVVNHTRCVVMDVADSAWYTKDCDGKNPFICKYTNETAPTPDPPITGSCPDGRWKDLNGGYCYLFSNYTKTWDEANRVCLQEMSDLASIHSAEEMRLIQLSIQVYTEPVWIGLFEKTSGGEGWSDGTSLNYINWQEGQPNSGEEQCTEVIPHSGKWNDAQCDDQRYYLCKTKKIPGPTDEPTVKPTTEKSTVKPTTEKSTLKPTTDQSTVTPTTDNPGDGNGGDNTSKGLGGGAIAGIVIALLVLFAVVGFVGYTCGRKPRRAKEPEHQQDELKNITSTAAVPGSTSC